MLIAAKLWSPTAVLPQEWSPTKMIILLRGKFPVYSLLPVTVATLPTAPQSAALKLAQVKQNKLPWGPAAAVSAYPFSASSLALQFISTQNDLLQMRRL